MKIARVARQRRRIIMYNKRLKKKGYYSLRNQSRISFVSPMSLLSQNTFKNLGDTNGSSESMENRRMSMARLNNKRMRNSYGDLGMCTETHSTSVYHEPGHGQSVITLDNSLHLAGQSSNICATKGLTMLWLNLLIYS